MTGSPLRVFTVGHGTRTTEELAAAVLSASVDLIVDVRRFPGSRRHPHFARERLEHWLPPSGISYAWWGETLGGRRRAQPGSRHHAWRVDAFRAYADHTETAAFRDAIVELEDLATSHVPAVMCAETVWWRCHRRLIADALVLRGADVVHILSADDRQPHKLHPQVRVDEEGWPVYDVGETPPLV